jgi:hypothetical protein
LLGNVLRGESWHAWHALLLATCGESLEQDELEIFQRVTGRNEPPSKLVAEAVYIIEAVFKRSSFKDEDFNTENFKPGTSGEVKLRNALIEQLFA